MPSGNDASHTTGARPTAPHATDRGLMVGALAADAAHELNNLLGGILMAAQYAISVLDRDDATAKLRKALADIEHDAQLGGEIVGGLLRFARGELVEPTVCEVDALVREAVALARDRRPGSTAEIRFGIAPSLPALRARVAELRYALATVVVDALEAGADLVEIAATAPDELRLTVRDDGTPHEESPDSVPKARSRRRGADLALRLAQAAVRDHAGTMDVASCAVEGTCVTLRLPLTRGT